MQNSCDTEVNKAIEIHHRGGWYSRGKRPVENTWKILPYSQEAVNQPMESWRLKPSSSKKKGAAGGESPALEPRQDTRTPTAAHTEPCWMPLCRDSLIPTHKSAHSWVWWVISRHLHWYAGAELWSSTEHYSLSSLFQSSEARLIFMYQSCRQNTDRNMTTVWLLSSKYTTDCLEIRNLMSLWLIMLHVGFILW